MSTWPDLIALELLVAIAEQGSLSRAAQACQMAQPNASRSLGRLERHLGVTLVARGPRGSTLTPEGLLVVDWSRPVLAAARRWQDGAASLGRGGTESIGVAASQTIAEHLLPGWVARLFHAAPGTRVQIRIANSAGVVRLLLEGQVRLGFIEGPQAPGGVRHAVIGRDELVVVVAPTHPWARRNGHLTADQLAAAPLLTREPESGTRRALEAALAPLQPVAPMLELASNAAVRVGAIAGTAPAVLSRLAVDDALRSGALVEVPVDGVDLTRQLRVAWTGPQRLRGVARTLAEIARTPPTAGRDVSGG